MVAGSRTFPIKYIRLNYNAGRRGRRPLRIWDKMVFKIKTIENENELTKVLNMCYRILGEHLREVDNYRYHDWFSRMKFYNSLLLFAQSDDDGEVVAAVLGRPESKDGLVMGFCACEKEYRMKGIAKALVKKFEQNARKLGYKYISLGSADNACKFYEKCGYHVINELHGQKIFQKLLD